MSANSQPLVATIYNPHNQSKEALIAGFIARKQKFERIFRDIRDAPMTKPEQHYLIQGIRGMGKTTLLLRIAYEIDNTLELRQRLIPIVFNEEEYGISSLSDVWERTAQYLGETDVAFSDLYDTITKLYGQDDYEQKALQTLIDALHRQDKKLLLLIDNIGDVLKKLDTQEEKRLREVLLTTSELRLIGATSVAIEQVHDYTKPFYEFFKMIHLEGLNRQEAIELFLKLGETYHTDAVRQLIERQPGRIEAIRRLTGGVIRTMVLLFEILVENDSGSVFRDLKVLLDRVTPLYKHRLDDLPAQQQKIVAALAQAWDAASTKELAQVVRLESKVVSAQLKQLIDNNVVEKVETKTKNHLYRLEERFFNIWYLMRFSRKTDQRILWLTRFFETMFAGDSEWMQERIDNHLKAMEIGTSDPEAASYVTEAFRQLLKNEDFSRYTLLEATYKYIREKDPQILKNINYDELSDKEVWINYLKNERGDIQTKERYKKSLAILEELKNPSGASYYHKGMCYIRLGDYPKAEIMFLKGMEMGYGTSTYWLGRLYLEIYKDTKKAWNYFKKALEQGDLSSYVQMAIIKQEKKRYKEAFTLYDMALEAGVFWAGIEANNFAAKINYFPEMIYYKRLYSLIEIFSSFLNYMNYIDDQSKITKIFYNLFTHSNADVTYRHICEIESSYDIHNSVTILLSNTINIWLERYDNIKHQNFEFLDEYRSRFSEKLEDFTVSEKFLDLNNDSIWLGYLTKLYIQLLLAKKQYHTAYNYFQQEEWQLKDRFKPLYYATLYFLQDEYSTEYLRMGPELKETVGDVLSEVAQMAIDYA